MNKLNVFFNGEESECLNKFMVEVPAKKKQVYKQLLRKYKSMHLLVDKINNYVTLLGRCVESGFRDDKMLVDIHQIEKSIGFRPIEQNLNNLRNKIMVGHAQVKKKNKNIVQVGLKTYDDDYHQLSESMNLVRSKTDDSSKSTKSYNIQRSSDTYSRQTSPKYQHDCSTHQEQVKRAVAELEDFKNTHNQIFKEKQAQIERIKTEGVLIQKKLDECQQKLSKADEQLKKQQLNHRISKEEVVSIRNQKSNSDAILKQVYVEEVEKQTVTILGTIIKRKMNNQSKLLMDQNQVIFQRKYGEIIETIISEVKRYQQCRILQKVCLIFQKKAPSLDSQTEQKLTDLLISVKENFLNSKKQFERQIKSKADQIQKQEQQIETLSKIRKNSFQSNFEHLPHYSLMLSSKIISFNGISSLNLQKNKQHCEFLIKSIEEFFNGRKIQLFKPLYSYSYFKPVQINPHIYIDNNPCLLFIAQLKNADAIIGAFAEAPFSQNLKGNAESRGFLFSVKKQRVFNQTSKGKGRNFNPHDIYNFAFGNGDLKFEMNTKIITSNIGLNSSYFTESASVKVHDMFEQGDLRVVEMLDYEFFQVIF